MRPRPNLGSCLHVSDIAFIGCSRWPGFVLGNLAKNERSVVDDDRYYRHYIASRLCT